MNKTTASYAYTREINGVCIPLPIQTAYIRNFLSNLNVQFSLPHVEITHATGFPILRKLLIESRESISFCSILIFPTDKSIRDILKNEITTKFIFCMENLIFSQQELITFLDNRDEMKMISNATFKD
jgi:sporadic carbohydrate cluster protein (TIGR04323 family)